jgi:hypothetical protein
MKEDSFVHVRWLDSGLFHENGWETREQIIPKARTTSVDTVGILLFEDDDNISVALSMDPDNKHYFGVQTISKKNVEGMWNVEHKH